MIENMIWVVHPGIGSWLFIHPGSRIQGSKRHRIRIRNTYCTRVPQITIDFMIPQVASQLRHLSKVGCGRKRSLYQRRSRVRRRAAGGRWTRPDGPRGQARPATDIRGGTRPRSGLCLPGETESDFCGRIVCSFCGSWSRSGRMRNCLASLDPDILIRKYLLILYIFLQNSPICLWMMSDNHTFTYKI
jgi:hypothetical protein